MHLCVYGPGTSAPFVSNQYMFAVVSVSTPNVLIYDVSATNTQTLVDTIAGSAATAATSMLFNKYLFFFDSLGNVRTYNGTAWAAGTYTFPASFVPFGGEVYKNRSYMINYSASGGTTYVYSGIDAIGGATNPVDLASVFSKPGVILGIKAVALSEGIQQETVLAFVSSSGEILVYGGTYPGGDWSLRARFQVATPTDYHPFIDAKGDSFAITNTGIVSLRTLFTSGVDLATTQGISQPISNRWRVPFFQSIAVSGIKGVYDILNDRLIIHLWKTVDHDDNVVTNSCMKFIFNFRTQSWQETWVSLGSGVTGFSGGVVYFDNRVFYTTFGYRGILRTGGASNYVDASVNAGAAQGFPYQLRTAPLYTENFGVNVTVGLELLSKTDLYAQTSYKLISNLGQITTTGQLLANQGSGVQNPYINIGIDAKYLQVDISGTTTSAASVGQEIYAMNLWSDKGGAR